MRDREEETRAPKSRTEEIALAEIEWFHTRFDGKMPARNAATAQERYAAMAIAGWLGQLATFHVGAMSLRFARREWPCLLMDEFGPWTSLIVRLECATHPSDGYASTAALEAAATIRLEEMLADERRYGPTLTRLHRHAFQHVRAAARAYVKVRGREPSVLPIGPSCVRGESR